MESNSVCNQTSDDKIGRPRTLLFTLVKKSVYVVVTVKKIVACRASVILASECSVIS